MPVLYDGNCKINSETWSNKMVTYCDNNNQSDTVWRTNNKYTPTLEKGGQLGRGVTMLNRKEYY